VRVLVAWLLFAVVMYKLWRGLSAISRDLFDVGCAVACAPIF
jgi:hypothetical protein